MFVPDPQYLGYVNLRLSDVAAEISHDYVETANYVKLIRAEGEIDCSATPLSSLAILSATSTHATNQE